jgi:hypothetical protein
MVPHVDHIWINTHIQQCMSKVVETYWTNHKPMYLAPNFQIVFHNIIGH